MSLSLLWFIIALISTGLGLAYINTQIKKGNFFDSEKENKGDQLFFGIIISVIFGLFCFILIPIGIVYKLGKKIFK